MDDSFWPTLQVWEKQTAEAWTQLVRSAEFTSLMNEQLESWLVLKQQFDRALSETLRTAGLPTRAEQDHILYQVHELEGQVNALAERIDRLVERLSRKED